VRRPQLRGSCRGLRSEHWLWWLHSERRRLAVVQSDVTASVRPSLPPLADAGAFQSA
jgi:hypothetical protein